ncbi:LuxR C-terminal-related transcriptional regulator [Paenibacillus sp. J2TS4]|uniref:LuxR C-terminal-related transcriptional regulator n=1 Tax=Paenibacillus sp. J2TS4 TaxID=2807194 RepID=UPI001BCAAB0C|nr:LuxR C-terminal-related transcriptional regulator [Paenibacillus sp. J2TS4]
MYPQSESRPLSHLLQTKLHIPGTGSTLVQRPSLRRLLDQGLGAKLTLVTAPAGFGKSTLITEWIRQQPYSYGWISLDGRDNDLVRFMEYLIAALRPIQPGLCDSVLQYIQETRNLSVETAMTLLMNEVQALNQEIIIILDDYHVICESSIHHGLTFLLTYLPRNMHMVIASRSEPQLPLSAMLARRQLVRISANDLRFTADEIRELFELTVEKRLTKEELACLERRTEGWIAGLQMILLSGGEYGVSTTETNLFIDSFKQHPSEEVEGDIADYLTEEVLARQSPDVQQFLLKTAVLERMNESLCRHIIQKESGQSLYEAVQAGLFLIPLDRDRVWYRYHHMFGRLLYNRLTRQYAEIVPELHRRASEWFRINGYTVEAVEHAVAATDFNTACELIVQEASELLRNEMHMLLRWFGQFPENLLTHNPALAVLYAWSLATFDRLEEAEDVLDRAEPYLDTGETELQSLNGEDILGYFAAMRCMICLGRNETEKAVVYNEEIMRRLGGVGNISTAYIVGYNHDGESLLRGRFGFFGGLKQTLAIYPPLIARWQSAHDHFYGYLHTAIGECYYERDDLAQAEKYVNIGASVGLKCENAGIFVPALLTKARMSLAHGEQEAAFALVQEVRNQALRIHALSFMPVIDAFEARLFIRAGQPQHAARWAENCRLQVDGWIDPSREFEQITLLRLLVSLDDGETAYRYAERLVQVYELKNRKAAVVEIRIVQALLLERQKNLSAAVKKLDQSLVRAFSEGYIRLFADEGAKLYRLLTLWKRQRSSVSKRAQDPFFQDYTDTLFSFFQEEDGASPQHLLSRLTRQEMNVLNLLAQGFANRDIAETLSTSTETVKRHCKNIYKKLSVSNRHEAVSLLSDHFIV